MYYIIQENTFREKNYNLLIDTIHNMGLEFEIVKVLPFTDELEFKTNRKDVFCFGALKMARIAKEFNWTPGSLMNSNHDYEVYKNYWKENLLNYDSKVHTFIDEIEFDSEYKFIRPCLDSKVFTGKVFTKEEWCTFVNDSLLNGHTTFLNTETKIQVSSPKNIQKEIRFWVVNGKIITGSQYRLGGRVCYDSNIDIDAFNYTQSMVDIFSLADCFVIDICMVEGEYKIVEAGCINCAGFYEANLQKLITALENYYNPI